MGSGAIDSLEVPRSPPVNGHSSERSLPSGGIPRELEEALDLDMDSETPMERDNVRGEDEEMDATVDFEDYTKPPMTPLNPFGANGDLESSEPVPFRRTDAVKPPLSDAQEQRLIAYLDARTMEIQRLFVKYLAKGEDIPKWSEIVHLIDNLLEFVWFGITGAQSGVRGIYHWNVYKCDMQVDCIKIPQTSELELASNLKSNGCPSYLLTIMGELITYIAKQAMDTYEDWMITLTILAKLDDALCVLIDYGSLITVTEKVRVSSIVQRTKMVVVELFEAFSRETQRRFDPSTSLLRERETISQFQTFAGEVYEGLSDRTSI